MASFTWDDLRTGVDNFAKKANRKAEQLANSAAVQLKLSAKHADLEEEYTKLGRFTFERMYNVTATPDAQAEGEVDPFALDREIAASVARITELRAEIDELQAKAAKS